MNKRRIGRTLGRVAGVDAVLLVPVVAITLFDGNRRIASVLLDQISTIQSLVGGAELFVGAAALWLTVERWARWIPSFVALAGIKALISVWTGRKFSFPNEPFARVEAAIVVLYCALAAALTWRYLERKPTRNEGMALLTLLFSTFPVLFFGRYPLMILSSTTIGLLTLGVVRIHSGLGSTRLRK